MKFRIGDRVRITNNCGMPSLHGALGVITGISTAFKVHLDDLLLQGNEEPWSLYDDEIEHYRDPCTHTDPLGQGGAHVTADGVYVRHDRLFDCGVPAAELDARQAQFEGGKSSNPKDAAAVGRVPMHMVPATLTLYAAMGFAEGDSKYIAYNFRVAGVRASVYISAYERHWTKWKNGQWCDPKTKVPHLASCASCLSILIDGFVGKTIVDDRPPPIDLDEEFAQAEDVIKHVYEMNRDKRPVGVEYTIGTHPAVTA